MFNFFRNRHGVFENSSTAAESETSQINDTETNISDSKILEFFLVFIAIVLVIIYMLWTKKEASILSKSVYIPDNKPSILSKVSEKSLIKPHEINAWNHILVKIREVETLRLSIYQQIAKHQDPVSQILLNTPTNMILTLPHLNGIDKSNKTLPVLIPFPPLAESTIALHASYAPVQVNNDTLKIPLQSSQLKQFYPLLQQSIQLQQQLLQQLITNKNRILNKTNESTIIEPNNNDFFKYSVHQYLKVPY